MRVGNALLVAGIVIVIAALSGVSLAADDGGRMPAEADVVAPEDAAGVGEPSGEEGEPAEPAPGESDRVPGEVETEEVAPTEEEPDRGEGGRKGSGEKDRKERREARQGDKQPRAGVNVTMKNIQFSPKTITINPGDEVTWTNRDTAQHDADATKGEFDTALLSKGESETVPINGSGTINYICTVHPTMKGKVVLSSGGTGGSSGTSSGTGGTSSGFGGTSSGTGGTFDSGFSSGSGSGSNAGGGSLPNTGQAELPLLLLGASLIVFGLLARAFHEYWIWR